MTRAVAVPTDASAGRPLPEGGSRGTAARSPSLPSPPLSPAADRKRSALVVLGSGANRTAVARTLSDAGFSATTVSDPFRASASFALAPADVVVAGLAGWRRRDTGFFAALRARAPAVVLVALAPPADRRLAVPALDAGADVVLGEPVDLDELAAVVRRLAARTPASPGAESDAAVRALCADVGHAINNPLQVASLLLEDAGTPPYEIRAGVARELRRIQDVVAKVTAFGRLPLPAPAPVPVGRILAAAIGAVAKDRPLADPRPAATDDPTVVSGDEAQLVAAIEAAVRFLAARTGDTPLPLRVAVAPSVGPHVDVLLRVEGVRLEGEAAGSALRGVLDVDERTREIRTGLGFVRSVLEGHGGALEIRTPETPGKASALRLRLPR